MWLAHRTDLRGSLGCPNHPLGDSPEVSFCVLLCPSAPAPSSVPKGCIYMEVVRPECPAHEASHNTTAETTPSSTFLAPIQHLDHSPSIPWYVLLRISKKQTALVGNRGVTQNLEERLLTSWDRAKDVKTHRNLGRAVSFCPVSSFHLPCCPCLFAPSLLLPPSPCPIPLAAPVSLLPFLQHTGFPRSQPTCKRWLLLITAFTS